jgi:hypothetical protein
MKLIKKINTIAITTPFIIALLGLFEESFLLFALISTMATGFIQLTLGIILLLKFKNNIHYKIYFAVIIIFFSLSFWSPIINKVDYFTYTLIYIPPILAIYISVLIYKTPHK